MAKDKFVEKITIEYNNGEKQEIEKGFVVEFSKKENSIETYYNMCNISGKELELVVSSILKLGTVLGMFD
ncbi:MAG: hypothetical protein UD936_04175 [Acutalibacteraceae bacterium]|nr:hypothetical protein [Acutalibacteraceae bacterium]